METIDMATTDANGEGPGTETPFESARRAFSDTASSFTGQAGTKARDYAAQGKDRAVEALDNVAGLVGDAANQVSAKLGDQYGGYVQQAADAVSGLASTLRDKDTDDLIDDARNVVRSSPAIAIAAAATVGFLLARVVKSGFTAKPTESEPTASPAAKPRKSAVRKAGPKAPLADTPIAETPITDTPAPDSPPSAV